MALTRNRLLLAKIEATYGTDADCDGTDALLVSNLEVNPLQIELLDRELIQPYLGNSEKVAGQRMASVTFDVELVTSGTVGTAPRWGRLMRACAFEETIVASTSVTYAPISDPDTMESVTVDFWADNKRHLITGCRGTWSLTANVGEIPKISFELMGIYNDVTDDPKPTPITFGDQADPLAVNSDNTTNVEVHDYAACMESFSLTLGNENPFKQLAGCDKSVRVTQRAPSGEVTIEDPELSAMDYFAAVSAQDLGNVTWQHTDASGGIITFTAPTCNLDAPSYADSDGVQMLTLPFMPVPTSAGDDEFTIVLT